MTKQQFINWAKSKGWKEDSYGHLQKTAANGKQYRFKLSSTSVRYEKKAHIVDHNEWLRILSGYYKDLSITPEGKLTGLKR